MSCKVITYGSDKPRYLPSKMSHFRSLPVFMHKILWLFKTPKIQGIQARFLYTQNVSNMEHFQKVLTQAKHAKGRSDILSILFCRDSGCAPLLSNTDRLIWTTLSEHQEDIALISQP